MYSLPKADLWVRERERERERDQKGDGEIPTDLFCQTAKNSFTKQCKRLKKFLFFLILLENFKFVNYYFEGINFAVKCVIPWRVG
jgi:hypothetical protein